MRRAFDREGVVLPLNSHFFYFLTTLGLGNASGPQHTLIIYWFEHAVGRKATWDEVKAAVYETLPREATSYAGAYYAQGLLKEVMKTCAR